MATTGCPFFEPHYVDLASSFGNSIATFPTIINFELSYGHTDEYVTH